MIWKPPISTGTDLAALFFRWLIDQDLKFGVAAGIPGIGGTIAVENRLFAENEFADFVASLTKVWSSIWNTQQHPTNRCRELYLVSIVTKCLSNTHD